MRAKHDRLFLVSQHFQRSLHDVMREHQPGGALFDASVLTCVPPTRLTRYAGELVSALDYLARNNVVHRNLHPDNILLSVDDHVKLADYEMYAISRGGKEVRPSSPPPVRCSTTHCIAGAVFRWLRRLRGARSAGEQQSTRRARRRPVRLQGRHMVPRRCAAAVHARRVHCAHHQRPQHERQHAGRTPSH